MNWLMYVGGGFVWLFLTFLIIRSCIVIEKFTKPTDYNILLPPILGSVMMWIWICWKFIR
jgi:hypothetical protein